MHGFTQTAYHGRFLYGKHNLSAGFGWKNKIAVVSLTDRLVSDISVEASKYDWRKPWIEVKHGEKPYAISVFPANDSVNNNPQHASEYIDFTGDGSHGANCGTPIYIRREGDLFEKTEAKLQSAILKGPRGEIENPIIFHRYKPVEGTTRNYDMDMLVPRDKLKPGNYEATFLYDNGIRVQWKFHVGRR